MLNTCHPRQDCQRRTRRTVYHFKHESFQTVDCTSRNALPYPPDDDSQLRCGLLGLSKV